MRYFSNHAPNGRRIVQFSNPIHLAESQTLEDGCLSGITTNGRARLLDTNDFVHDSILTLYGFFFNFVQNVSHFPTAASGNLPGAGNLGQGIDRGSDHVVGVL